MRAAFTPLADADLEEIADFIALDNPERALSFVRELREHCNRIAGAPLAYVARPELGKDIRSCVHGHYVIFFKPVAGDEPILVVRILQGSRDLGRAFPQPGS